jgi:hypothetical protein
MNPVNFNAPWHPLRHAWVGASYAPEFYAPIKNSRIRNSLQKIAKETEEDYQNLVKVLTELGVKVSRPTIDPELTIMNYVDNSTGVLNYDKSGSFTLIPRPPMQPRDSVLVVGTKFLATNAEIEWFEPLFGELDLDSDQQLKFDLPFDAPLVTVVGQHLIVDCREYPWLGQYCEQQFPDRTIVPVFIGGHNDAVYCPVKPGVIISTHHHSNYEHTFPGWEVKFIENQSWNAIPDWRRFKHQNVDKWWVPDADTNPEFENFVDTWLSHWLGYVKETVFDVNMLQINPELVLVNNHNQEMFDFFDAHKIHPIVVPFRHRFFWDGGIHCITADIERTGDMEVYIDHAR